MKEKGKRSKREGQEKRASRRVVEKRPNQPRLNTKGDGRTERKGEQRHEGRNITERSGTQEQKGQKKEAESNERGIREGMQGSKEETGKQAIAINLGIDKLLIVYQKNNFLINY